MSNGSKFNAWLRRLFTRQSPDTMTRQALESYRLLALLLPALEARGFLLSPDVYIRLFRMLEILSPDAAPTVWRHSLCAVLASNEEQQHTINQLYDQFLEVIRADRSSDSPAKPTSLPPEDQTVKPTDISRPETSNPASARQTNPKRGTVRQPLVVDLEECTDPPFSWNIVPESEGLPIETGSQFGRTLLQLRRRETADHLLPDLPASIRATIAQGGVPTFQYRSLTRPTEYLLLVERYTTDDHRAALFDHFYHTLRHNDVLIERFFYQGDLRLCRNDRYPAGLSLQQLRYRYPDARLVTMGTGYRLLSPKTGLPADWLRPLYGWRRRVLLTPISRLQWGQRERALQGLFTLLPASLSSLHYLSDAPDEALHGGYDALPEYVRRIAEVEPLNLEDQFMRGLRRHFDSGQLCWIASCAVYPALHYELTLRLGKLLSECLGYNLLTAANLLAVARIPWFTEGRIPQEARNQLIEWMEFRYPEEHRRVTDFLHELMVNNPPPENSMAWAEHRINLALMELARNPQPDAETKAQLHAVVKRLNRPQRRSDFVLPRHWEQLLEKIGFPEEEEPINEAVAAPAGEEAWRDKMLQPVQIFIAYAREDNKLLSELRVHLRPLEHSSNVHIWYDGLIEQGVEWEAETKEHLHKADIIILMVSSDALRSDYFYNIAMPAALERHKMEETKVVPLIMSPCDWEASPLARLHALPRNGKPVTMWTYRNKAFVDAVIEISKIIEVVTEKKRSLEKPKSNKPALPPAITQLEADMVSIEGGSFVMGWKDAQRDGEGYNSEKPARTVQVAAFSLGRYPVTQAQWHAVMGSNPSHFKGCDNCPVERVSWNDIQDFLQKLNALTGKNYRLPSEAEWEYAARGGAQSQGYLYSGSNKADEVAWYNDNSGSKTHPVGGKKPNELGLYDMSGNVWEWCEDDWHDTYQGAPTDSRPWVNRPRGGSRVLRGGSWGLNSRYLRAAARFRSYPVLRNFYFGFRLARD